MAPRAACNPRASAPPLQATLTLPPGQARQHLKPRQHPRLRPTSSRRATARAAAIARAAKDEHIAVPARSFLWQVSIAVRCRTSALHGRPSSALTIKPLTLVCSDWRPRPIWCKQPDELHSRLLTHRLCDTPAPTRRHRSQPPQLTFIDCFQFRAGAAGNTVTAAWQSALRAAQ